MDGLELIVGKRSDERRLHVGDGRRHVARFLDWGPRIAANPVLVGAEASGVTLVTAHAVHQAFVDVAQ